jgi:hypothetical protein
MNKKYRIKLLSKMKLLMYLKDKEQIEEGRGLCLNGPDEKVGR